MIRIDGNTIGTGIEGELGIHVHNVDRIDKEDAISKKDFDKKKDLIAQQMHL